MNFVAHSVVAVRCGMTEPDQILGAVLGDLTGMARIRFDDARLPPSVLDGVRLHWAADRAFHADAAFLAGAGALRVGASSVGVGRGPARAVGHAGWELLLDGQLAPDSDGALVTALEIAPSLSAACATDRDAASWGLLVARMAAGRWWHRYGDPAFVAERLFDMLNRRPRLAFERSQMPAVAEVLARGQPSVAAEAEAVLARVVVRVRAEGD